MKTGLLLVTHAGVGEVLLQTAIDVLGMCPLQARALPVDFDADPDQVRKQALEWFSYLDQGGGVLVLTDMYGGTPGNIAASLAGDGRRVAVIAGVNLPMLVRILNYPDLDIEQLADKALGGGRDGIVLCDEIGGER